jgi:hypothetical protein
MDVGMFNPLVFLCEDYDLFLKVARSHKIAHLPLTLTSYRKLEESLSSDYERMDQQLQQLCDRHFLHPQSEETKKAARIGYKNHRMHIGRTAYDQGRKAFRERNWGAFFKHLLAALKRNPRFILLSLLHWLKLRVVPGATTSSAHDQSRF